MKKILLSLGFIAIATTGAYAQVGVGTDNPDKSAQLEVKATDKGLLIPRITLTAIDQTLDATGTNSNAKSLLIFSGAFTHASVSYPEGYYYWDGVKWVHLLSTAEASINNIFETINNDNSSVTYNSTNKSLNVRANNGVGEYKHTDGKEYVGLGGDLVKETTIGLAGNELKLNGLGVVLPENISTDVNGIVVVRADGSLKQVGKVQATLVGSQISEGTTGVPVYETAGKVLAANGSGGTEWKDLIKEDNSGIVKAQNGVSIKKVGDDHFVQLGGKLIEETTIKTNGTNKLVIDGDGTSGVGGNLQIKDLEDGAKNDNIVVADSEGNIKQVGKVQATQIGSDGVAEAGQVLATDGSEGAVWKDLIKEDNSGIVKAQNGVSIKKVGDDHFVQLGGNLKDAETTIGTALNKKLIIGNVDTSSPDIKTNLEIPSLPDSTEETDEVLVVDNTSGKVKKVAALVGDVTGNLRKNEVSGIKGKTIEGFDAPGADDTGKVLVYDNTGDSGKGAWKAETLKEAATINYSSTPQETGRKWTLGSTPAKPIMEVTMEVNFGDGGATAIYLGGTAGGTLTSNPVLANLDVTIVSARLVSQSNGGVTQSIASYDKDDNGKVVVGMSGIGFSVTHKGKYYVILEYFEN